MASTFRAIDNVRQMSALTPPAGQVLHWQPLGRVMLAAGLFLMIGNPANLPLRLSIASAAVAATSAFLLDDPATATLAASPTSLPVRRLHRIVVALLAVGLWWIAAVALAINRADSLPLRGRALEISVFVAIALAASATASTIGDRTAGGIAGTVFALGCYATTFLPPWTWLPLPPHPGAPDATTRLVTVLIAAVAVLAWVSRDPARRTDEHVPRAR